eukprot:SAG31_NODE_8860_length_1373_cov_2.654631_1_plen_284_part_01
MTVQLQVVPASSTGMRDTFGYILAQQLYVDNFIATFNIDLATGFAVNMLDQQQSQAQSSLDDLNHVAGYSPVRTRLEVLLQMEYFMWLGALWGTIQNPSLSLLTTQMGCEGVANIQTAQLLWVPSRNLKSTLVYCPNCNDNFGLRYPSIWFSTLALYCKSWGGVCTNLVTAAIFEPLCIKDHDETETDSALLTETNSDLLTETDTDTNTETETDTRLGAGTRIESTLLCGSQLSHLAAKVGGGVWRRVCHRRVVYTATPRGLGFAIEIRGFLKFRTLRDLSTRL